LGQSSFVGQQIHSIYVTASYPTVGDQWYDTVEDVLYEYIDDGTTTYWVDIQTSIIAATAATNPGDLHPFLLAGM
jgi:hypothetical protein